MYIYSQVDVHPLLRLPTSTHRALPSPAQPATSRFHCSLRRQTKSPACLSHDRLCPRTWAAPVPWQTKVSHEVGPARPAKLPRAWRERPCPSGAGTALGTGRDRAGHVRGLSQLHGGTFGGQKGREETSPTDWCFRGARFPWQPFQPSPPRGGCHKESVDIATASWGGGGEGVRGRCHGNVSPTPVWRERREAQSPVSGQRWPAEGRDSHVCPPGPPRTPNLGDQEWPSTGLAIQPSNGLEYFIHEKRTLLSISEIIPCWSTKTDGVGSSRAGDVTC